MAFIFFQKKQNTGNLLKKQNKTRGIIGRKTQFWGSFLFFSLPFQTGWTFPFIKKQGFFFSFFPPKRVFLLELRGCWGSWGKSLKHFFFFYCFLKTFSFFLFGIFLLKTSFLFSFTYFPRKEYFGEKKAKFFVFFWLALLGRKYPTGNWATNLLFQPFFFFSC